MGACISTSSQRTCGSDSKGDGSSSSCLPIQLCSRKSKRTYTDHIATLKHLSSIPNRVFMNGTSQSSCLFTQQGRKGINQDAMIVWEDFLGDDVTFCGIFDGHGPHGHLVARKVRDALPLKLLSFLKELRSSATSCDVESKSDSANAAKDGSAEEKSNSMWRDAFLKSFKVMDKELKSHPTLDCFCSGSTAATIVKQGSNLFMGYIGDSRAIMGFRDSDDALLAIQLTVDLKPDLPREAERIKQCKGRVFALQDEPEVSRVWLPFDDAPGLAMARAFGDFCLKEYGVISMPEFSRRILTERDQFIVLASDGVWDVLSNEQVIKIVSSVPSRASAARVLVESAANEWKLKYPTSKMDDCAVVCLFLDGKMDTELDHDEPGFCSATTQSHHSGVVQEYDDGQNSEPSFQSMAVTSSEENDCFRRSPLDVIQSVADILTEDQNWSGLVGITRVNSLVQLPRFSDERPKS